MKEFQYTAIKVRTKHRAGYVVYQLSQPFNYMRLYDFVESEHFEDVKKRYPEVIEPEVSTNMEVTEHQFRNLVQDGRLLRQFRVENMLRGEKWWRNV